MANINFTVPYTFATFTVDVTLVANALTAAGYTVTAPQVAPPVVIPPVVLPAGNGAVFVNGKYNWAGDWNAVPFNYVYPDHGVTGPGPVISMPGSQAFEYWLPYPPNNVAGPATNGVNFDLTPFTKFTISIKPTVAGATAQMQFFKSSGGVNDIDYGNMLNLTQAKYGPATMVAGQWNTYTIPLTDFAVSGWIYKFIVQQQGVTPQAWEIDQVEFL